MHDMFVPKTPEGETPESFERICREAIPILRQLLIGCSRDYDYLQHNLAASRVSLIQDKGKRDKFAATVIKFFKCLDPAYDPAHFIEAITPHKYRGKYAEANIKLVMTPLKLECLKTRKFIRRALFQYKNIANEFVNHAYYHGLPVPVIEDMEQNQFVVAKLFAARMKDETNEG